MALEATHVRFALDLLPVLPVVDIGGYCAGAVYPDTRYVTRVDRNVTHGLDCPHDPFAEGLTDFQRGWATHLLYDHLAGDAMKQYLSPELGSLSAGSPAWVEFTAMKVVEDLETLRRRPDVLDHLRRLSIRKSPSGESLEQLQLHFSLTSTLYRSVPEFREYSQWFCAIGAPKDLTYGIAGLAQSMVENAELFANLTAIYEQTLAGVLVDQLHKTA